jgi:hypothetical protein
VHGSQKGAAMTYRDLLEVEQSLYDPSDIGRHEAMAPAFDLGDVAMPEWVGFIILVLIVAAVAVTFFVIGSDAA